MPKLPTIRIKEAFTESMQLFLFGGNISACRVELRDIQGNLIGALFMYSDDDEYWGALGAIEA